MKSYNILIIIKSLKKKIINGKFVLNVSYLWRQAKLVQKHIITMPDKCMAKYTKWMF